MMTTETPEIAAARQAVADAMAVTAAARRALRSAEDAWHRACDADVKVRNHLARLLEHRAATVEARRAMRRAEDAWHKVCDAEDECD